MSGETYNVIHGGQGVPIKAWTKGVQLEDQAKGQLLNVAQLPFVFQVGLPRCLTCIGESARRLAA